MSEVAAVAATAVTQAPAEPALEPIDIAGLLPPGFLLGAATSAYQIEGGTRDDGRGESIWDRFCSAPGHTYLGHSGERACDHYHRYRDDVALMRQMGLQAYRFSAAWPRIFPTGTGPENAKGLEFYDRLVDCLLEAGIAPFLTLYHWDLPQMLQDRGGWYSRETAKAFGDYAYLLASRLGDRVNHWITHNEPWCSSWLGHASGVHAPGLRDGEAGAVKSAHNILLSHGYAVEALRAGAPGASVGISIDQYTMYPSHDNDADRKAARLADGERNRWFLDPVFRASYPTDVDNLIALLPDGYEEDLPAIGAPLDFLGVNYYERQVIRAGEDGRPVKVPQTETHHADNGREIYPRGLRDILKRMHEEYDVGAIYVTENGIGDRDTMDADGQVRDPRRAAFLDAHLRATADACRSGANVVGYFAWSLMDNFEWAKGYDDRERYGLVYVDYESQCRTVKSSGEWYANLISDRGAQIGNQKQETESTLSGPPAVPSSETRNP